MIVPGAVIVDGLEGFGGGATTFSKAWAVKASFNIPGCAM